MLSFFSGLWTKIAALLGVAVGFLLMLLKIKNNKIDNLEDENAALETKDHITEEMDKAVVKAKKAEVERNENRKDDDDSTLFDDI